MLDEADLATNLLTFVQKSFSFVRIAEVDQQPYALFDRTETESESKFRPRLVRLFVAVPQAWIILDPAQESLRLAPGGIPTEWEGDRPGVDVGHEKTEFQEQGIDWKRVTLPGNRRLYVPAELVGRLGTAEGQRRLGLVPA